MLHKHHAHHHVFGFLLSVILIGGTLGAIAGAMHKGIIFDASAIRADGEPLDARAQKMLRRAQARRTRLQRSGRVVSDVGTTYPMKASTLERETETRSDVSLGIATFVYPRLRISAPIGKPSMTYWKSRNWRELEEQMQYTLKNGLALYPHSPGTGMPGQLVVAGHSSAPTVDAIGTPYEDIFATIPDAVVGDMVEIRNTDGSSYMYKITDSKEISASQTSILMQDRSKSEVILFTCYPVGTTRNRWAVWGRLVQ